MKYIFSLLFIIIYQVLSVRHFMFPKETTGKRKTVKLKNVLYMTYPSLAHLICTGPGQNNFSALPGFLLFHIRGETEKRDEKSTWKFKR